MSRNLVVVTQTWKSLIESLKANSLHGYKKLDSVKFDGLYFTAILQQATDEDYLQALQQLTGEEKDGDSHKDTFLGVERRIEASEEVVEPLVEAVDTSNIQIKVKRQPRTKK